MYPGWRTTLFGVVPKPDERIHTLRISEMTHLELSIADDEVRGRFNYEFIAALSIGLLTTLLYIMSGSEASGVARIVMIGLLFIILFILIIRAFNALIIMRRRISLIRHEERRRLFDKVGRTLR